MKPFEGLEPGRVDFGELIDAGIGIGDGDCFEDTIESAGRGLDVDGLTAIEKEVRAGGQGCAGTRLSTGEDEGGGLECELG